MKRLTFGRYFRIAGLMSSWSQTAAYVEALTAKAWRMPLFTPQEAEEYRKQEAARQAAMEGDPHGTYTI